MVASDRRSSASWHLGALCVLLAAFCFRVGAQLLQAVWPVGWLPPFSAWQSGALPYPVLVASQVAIIGLYSWLIRGVASGSVRRRGLGVFLPGFGVVYFGFMAVRLVLGLTVMDGHPWWDRPIPSSFHLVLASFLLVAGDYHRRSSGALRG